MLTKVVRIIGAAAAILAGFILLFSAQDSVYAEAMFIGILTLVTGVYVWNGVADNQAKAVAMVLFLISLYTFLKLFGLFDLTLIRRLGGIIAICSGILLAVPTLNNNTKGK